MELSRINEAILNCLLGHGCARETLSRYIPEWRAELAVMY